MTEFDYENDEFYEPECFFCGKKPANREHRWNPWLCAYHEELESIKHYKLTEEDIEKELSHAMSEGDYDPYFDERG